MKSPFKFLDSYSKEDVNIFFGREKDVEEIYEKLFKSNLLLIYGASGTGKTSIVNCGIANKFLDTDWFPIHIRRKNNILESARAEIEKLAVTPIPVNKSLTDAVYSLYLDFFKPVYLVFDQFEELFISGDKNEQDGFTDFLVSLLDKRYNVKVIITVREEYLAYFALFEERLPDFFDNRYRVEFITRYKAEDIIVKTCRQAHIEIRDGKVVPEKIVTNVLSGAGKVELTYLQVYLDRLYNQYLKTDSPEEVIFSEALVNEVGDISDVLSLFLEEQIEKTNDQVFAWQMLKAFITENGTKKITTPASVKKYFEDNGKQIDEGKIAEYTSKFLQLKIIKPVDENKTYEITHDSLAGKIWERVSADDRAVFEVKTLISDAYKKHMSSNNTLLLRSEDLAYIKPYEEKLALSNEEADFLNKSRKRVFNKKVFTGAVIAAGMLILCLYTIYLFNAQKRALESERTAQITTKDVLAQKLVADSLRGLAEKRELQIRAKSDSMAQIYKAKLKSDSSNDAQLKLNAIQLNVITENNEVNAIKQSIKNDPTLGIGEAIKKYDLIKEDEKLKADLRNNVYSAFAGILYEKKENFDFPVRTVAVDDDKTFAVIVGGNNQLLYYNINSGEKKQIPYTGSEINSIALNNKTKQFAISDNRGNLWIGDKNSLKLRAVTIRNDVAEIKSLKRSDNIVIAYENGDADIYSFSGEKKDSVKSKQLRNTKSLKVVGYRFADFITVCNNSDVIIWDLDHNTNYILLGYKSDEEEEITDVDISSDGTSIAIATIKKIAVYKLSRKGSVLSIGENEINFPIDAPAEKINFLRTNEIIYTAKNGAFYYYSLLTKSIRSIQAATYKNSITTICKTKEPTIFVTGDEQGAIKFWNTSITQPIVFEYSYHDRGKAVTSTKNNYLFKRDSSENTITLAVKNEKNTSRFVLNNETPQIYKNLKLIQKEDIVILEENMKEVEIFQPVVPGKKKKMNIYKTALSDDGKYVMLVLRSENQAQFFYVIYPTFFSIKEFLINKK